MNGTTLLLVAVMWVAPATPATPPAAGTGAGQVLRFSGNGGKTIAPFRVLRPSTMYWRNSGVIFQIFNSGATTNGTVDSQAHRGTSFIPAGRYRLQVNAVGSWTMTIRTGVEPLGNPIRFRGNGGKALPSFRLSSGKTMYWTNTGALFQTFPAGATLNGMVNSQGHRGTTHLPAGPYQLYVNAAGSWSITIR
jgi:hypothetical protein